LDKVKKKKVCIPEKMEGTGKPCSTCRGFGEGGGVENHEDYKPPNLIRLK